MIKKIDFYFDFISPYSYLAHKKMKFFKKNILVNYKPILLGGLHNLEGITAPAFFKLKLRYMTNDTLLIAKKEKINFTWNSKFPMNSLNLMRGYLAVNSNFKNLYIDTMFDAYWKNNLDISNKEVLISLIKKCKIKKGIFFKGIQNKEIKNELRDLTKVAHDKGVFGAPTFVVNDKIFWGQDRLEYALDEYSKQLKQS